MNRERSHADVSRWLAELAERDVPHELDLWPRIVRRLEWSRAGSALRRELPPGSFERLVTGAAANADMRRPRSRRRQAFELAAGVVAFAVVATLLLVVFRGWGNASEEQPVALPTSTLVRQELLYVVSRGGSSGQGLVTAFDAVTGATELSIPTGPNPDAVASTDGRVLYVADVADVVDDLWTGNLSAYDVASGDLLWNVIVENRAHYVRYGGTLVPSTLAISPDGRRIYVYSVDGARGSYFVRILDSATGAEVGRIDDVAGCPVRLFPSGDGRSLYVVCLEIARGSAVQVLDLVQSQPAAPIPRNPITGTVVGAAAPQDGALLYVLSEDDSLYAITAIDMNARSRAGYQQVAHLGENPLHSLQLFALAPNGSQLFYGHGFEPDDARPYANQIWTVLPTGRGDAVWSYGEKFFTGTPYITGPTLVIASDNRSFFAVHNAYGEDGETPTEALIRYLAPGQAETFATLPGQEVLQMFSGWRTVAEVSDAPPTPEMVRQDLLYVVSHAGPSSPGLVTAFDMATGTEAFSIEAGPQVDAVASPDGQTLFVASVTREDWEDALTAYDVGTGEARWAVPLQHRILYHYGVGPSTLAVSPDGSRIYVRSAEDPSEYFVRVFDAATGAELARIDHVAGCPARLFPSGDGRMLYVVCLQTDQGGLVQILSLVEGRAGFVKGIFGTAVGAARSADGSYLYVLTERDERYTISGIDMNTGTVVHQEEVVANLGMNPLHALQLIALSPEGWLFFAVGSQPPDERPWASQIRMYSIQTPTFWRESARIATPLPITGPTLVAAPDDNSVFYVHNAYVDDRIPTAPTEATIHRLRWSGGTEISMTLPGQEVLQMFRGWRTVPAPEMEAPPSTANP